jgi:uncharacterized membrane protein YgdD (TMEM256/DUF423 family)
MLPTNAPDDLTVNKPPAGRCDDEPRAGRGWLIWASAHGFVSVACGAFGAHGLRDTLAPRMLENWETAARYQMYHALALGLVAVLLARYSARSLRAAGWCFNLGALIFSGSLYALVLSGQTKLGMITPVGGLSLLAGWALLAYTAIRGSR